MKKNLLQELHKSVRQILVFLVEKGLSTDQNLPIIIENKIITWPNYMPGIGFNKNIDYLSIYSDVESHKNYTIKLIDGGIIQFYYKVDKKNIVEHRLAFYPNPLLENYENYQESYEQDELYFEVVDRFIQKTPVRFDYNSERHDLIFEPKSHLHLGHTENCRIPISKPLCPYAFIRFILLSFYSSFYHEYKDNKEIAKNVVIGFESISIEEKSYLYFDYLQRTV